MKNNFGDKILANLLTMISGDEKFRSEVIAVRDKHHIPDSGFDEECAEKYGSDALFVCAEDLERLRVKYKLNEHYGVFLMFIICFARIPDKQIVNGAKSIELIKQTERSGLECAAIKIYPETSIQDIIKSWPKIKKFSKEVYGYNAPNQKPAKNALRDLYIGSLRRYKKSDKEIMQLINNIFDKDSATIGYGDIPKIVSRNKTRAKKLLKRK